MTISRRRFCALAGASVVGLGVPSCGGVEGRVTAGGLLDPNRPLVDLGQADIEPPQDLSGDGRGACNGMLDAGAASSYTLGQSRYFAVGVFEIFVVRDAQGLYALSAECTHATCTIKRQANRFHCPCHGATFNMNGEKPTGPALRPLDHYALCVDAAGRVLVDYRTVVSATTRA